MNLFRPFRRRLKEEPVWTVEIFYPICPAAVAISAKDPLDALKTVLRESLRTHGLVDPNCFDVVWGVFFEEPGHFRVTRKNAN